MNWILVLVLLACPLMHLWMMRKGGHGHGNHKEHGGHKKSDAETQKKQKC